MTSRIWLDSAPLAILERQQSATVALVTHAKSICVKGVHPVNDCWGCKHLAGTAKASLFYVASFQTF